MAKHMADGRPALVIGVGPGDEDGDSPDGDAPEEDVTDADGLETMRAFHEASSKGDHQGMWDAIRAAVKVASTEPEDAPEEDDAEGADFDDSEESIGEH